MLKKGLSVVLVLVMVLSALPLVSIPSFAETSGDWQYSVLNDGTAEIYSYLGDATELVIPTEIDGMVVTSIGFRAFDSSTSLTSTSITSIRIPYSVTRINSFAFYGCSSLTSINVPDGVTRIDACAFYGCASLASVTLPRSVDYIGVDAFHNCTSLTSITIPDSVEDIKDSTFCGCTSLTSITIPDSVTSIGDYAFGGCSSLTSITIPDSVTSIGRKAFYNCTSLQSITIPDSVTSFGDYAFSGCASLTSITILAGVTSIGSYAFSDCSSLTSATIPDSVEYIGVDAFSGCTSLVIYGNKESYAYTYAKTNGYKFVNINNGSLMCDATDDAYLIINALDSRTFAEGTAIGASGEAHHRLKNASADVDGTIYTFVESLPIPSTDKNKSVTLTANGFRKSFIPAAVLKSWFDDEGIKKQDIYMNPETGDGRPYVTGAYGRPAGENVFTNLLISKDIAFQDSSFEIVICADGNGSDVSEIYLTQDSIHKVTCSNGVVFTSVLTDVFNPAKPVYAVVKNKQGKTSVPVELKLSITNAKELDPTINLLGKDGLKYTVDDDVPLVGGAELSMDGFEFPIGVEIEGNRFKISLGVDVLSNDGDKWEWFKNEIGGLKESVDGSRKKLADFKKVQSTFSGSPTYEYPSKNWDLGFLGYIEGYVLDDGSLVVTDSSAAVTGEFKFRYTYQGVAPVIPVPIYAYVEAGGELTIVFRATKSLPDGDVPFEFSLTIGLTPKAKIGGGLGVKGAVSAGIYGKATLPITADFLNRHLTLSLTGELGVEAELFCFGGELKLLDGSVTLIDEYWGKRGKSAKFGANAMSMDGLSEADYETELVTAPLDRGYATTTSRFNSPMSPVLSSAGFHISDLQTSVFKNSLPQMVALDNGDLVAVYVTDDQNRSSANRMKLVCSVYQNGAWSEPFAVYDDGTNDNAPSIATDGTNVYVAWQDLNKTLSDGDTDAFTTIMESSEICVAKLNGEMNGFTNVKSITSNAQYDYMPKLAVSGSEVTVCWAQNTSNNLVTGKNNLLKYSFANANTTTVSSGLNYFLELYYDGDTVAVTQDMDGDLTTTADLAVCTVKGQGTNIISTSDDGAFVHVTGGNLNGQDVLVYANNSNIYSYANGETSTVATLSGFINGDLNLVNLNDETALIFTVVSEEGTEIWLVSYENGEWTEPVQITHEKALITNLSAVSSNGKLYALMNKTARSLEDEAYVSGQTDLCFAALNDYTDISADLLNIGEYAFEKGENTRLSVNVKNNGTESVQSLRLSLTDTFGTSTENEYEVALAPGEEKIIDIDYTVPDNFTRGTITINALPSGAEDINTEDNSSEQSVGYTDLSIGDAVVSDVGEYYVISTLLNNLSCVPANAVFVEAYENDEEGELLQVVSVGDFEAKQTNSLEYIISKSELDDGVNTICLKATTGTEESVTSNNYKYIVIDNTEKEKEDVCSLFGHSYDENGICSVCNAWENQTSAPKLVSVTNAKGGITVKWEALAGAEGYMVYRKTASSGWSLIASGMSATSYTDTKAAAGTQYTYTVKAYRGSANSKYDATGLSIVRLTNPAVKVANAKAGVNVTWGKVAGAKGYYVYRKTGSGSYSKIATTTALSYVDKTAKSGTTYTYAVRAYNGSTLSSYAGVKLIRLANTTVKLANQTAGVKVSWTKVAGAKGYYVYRKTGTGKYSKIATTTALSYLDKTAKAGVKYTYAVRAYNGSTQDAFTAVSIVRLATPNVKIANTKTGPKATWGKVAGAKGYYVYRKTAGGSYKRIATTTSLSYVDKTAKSGTRYYYIVKAYNGKVLSSYAAKAITCKK